MDLHLTNKVVVITGGAGKKGSIGTSMVQAVAEEGGIPAILDQNDRGYEYVKEFQKRGVDSLFVKADVTDKLQLEEAMGKVLHKYDRIDALINNIGVNDGVSLEKTYESFMDSIKLNLASYFLCTKLLLPKLKESKGTILNIGSKVSLTGQGGTSGYAAAKGGVLALTREWAVDLRKYDIRVNCLMISESWTPAYNEWIQTLDNGQETLKKIKEKIPFQKRMTKPQEIADTAMFLISDRSSHTTGQYVFVDGGYVHLDRALI